MNDVALFVFVFGVVAGVVAPVLWRFGDARCVSLAVGAAVLLFFAVFWPHSPRPASGSLRSRGQPARVSFCAGMRIAGAGACVFLTAMAKDAALLAWLGNPHRIHRVHFNGCDLAEVFLALVTFSGALREVLNRFVLARIGSTPSPS